MTAVKTLWAATRTEMVKSAYRPVPPSPSHSGASNGHPPTPSLWRMRMTTTASTDISDGWSADVKSTSHWRWVNRYPVAIAARIVGLFFGSMAVGDPRVRHEQPQRYGR